jgi:hypothetical protein
MFAPFALSPGIRDWKLLATYLGSENQVLSPVSNSQPPGFEINYALLAKELPQFCNP